ncbi:MAG: beta-L-arabinofuranosidase domain-containing protein, partial [Candidatus Acidiferrum sp.]
MKSEWRRVAGGLDRREFLRLAAVSSVMAIGGRTAMAGAESPEVPSYATLHALPPGAVRPEGWLRLYLEREASQLASKLPEVSFPFNKAYWAGEETAESWWPWEQKAYWVDGATRLALVLDDQHLMAQVRTCIDYTLTHAAEDGYLGPKFIQDPKGDFHRWPHALFFRSLSALSDAQLPQGTITSEDIVVAVRKHYLSDKADYGTPTRNVIGIESILWCYQRSGDRRLLDMAETAWKQYTKVAADPEHGDLSELRVYAATPINCHGVTYIEQAKLPAILYCYTGKQEYLKFALAAQRRIFDHHMLIDGIPSTSEDYRTITSLDSHETCDIADHSWSWGHILMATGQGVWGDHVERACFNAGMGAIRKDWKALQYFSCPNQFLATLDSDHNVMEHGSFLMAFQPNPGKEGACCGGNVHRIFSNYVTRMWMKSNDGGLAAVLYGPSKVTTTLGPDKQQVVITQTTRYPFEEQIHFKIDAPRTVSFPLYLRIPAWCERATVAINGATIPATRHASGFVVLNRKFTPGDTVTLTLPMRVSVTNWPQNGLGIERGPLVYSLPIKEKWTPVVEPKWTTADYPSWEATPESPWNYGIAV